MRARLSLQILLFLCFTAVSVVPVVLLGLWVRDSALKKEMAAVEEKHLLLARNLGAALQRYAGDVEAVFSHVAQSLETGAAMANASMLLEPFHIRHVCVTDGQGVVDPAVPPIRASGFDTVVGDRFPLALAPTFARAGEAPGRVVFSGVMKDAHDRPTLYLIRRLSDGRFAVGALGTDYMVALQKKIAFGQRGHAAIVDGFGRAMAHPVPAWRDSMKDMSFLPPVQHMKKGETGVITFYTPAMRSDVVAGYTAVPLTGWGVMIPQPVPELEARAADVEKLALAVIAIGLLVTSAFSWGLSRALAGPIGAVAAAAGQLAKGDRLRRIEAPPPPAPREVLDLVGAFNMMADDVTAKKEELLLEAARAEIASRSKSEFLAHMSHELRTPLNAIIGFSEVMDAGTFGGLANPRYEDYVRDILASAVHLRRLIDDVLTLAEAEAGTLGLASQTLEIRDMIDGALTPVRERARAKALILTVAVPPEAPMVFADDRICRQILASLLSNAVKFTPDGGSVRVTAETVDGGDYAIAVSDTGPGIAADELGKIGEPFAHIDDPMRRAPGGAGLGLHLAKRFLELHGGRLEIESRVGAGTTARAIFPAERLRV